MNVIHIKHSYIFIDKKGKEIYRVKPSFSDYKSFFKFIKSKDFDIAHIHSVGAETFGIYALIARFLGLKVVITLHTPVTFSYVYIIKQLFLRFFYNHVICTSKYISEHVHKYHLASKHSKSIVYEGVNHKKLDHYLTKESSRSYIYKRLGISFTKNIRIVGTIVNSDTENGLEHLIDTAYLADKYKNMTNTIFIILTRESISKDIEEQIKELGVEGLCFIVDYVDNPEEYLKAFDLYISPATRVGGLYPLIYALYVDLPCITTKTLDTLEFAEYVSAPLVPSGSAKYMTEALMYTIKKEKPIVFKAGIKSSSIPKKFTKEYEKQITQEIYEKVTKK